jgi:hypothetical protein
MNTIRSKISFIQIRLIQIDAIQTPNFHRMFMSVSSPMSKFMDINAFDVSVCVCWRFICYHMCILGLQPSLHLRTLRFWTERKLVLYLTFSFQPKIQVLNMYKFIVQTIRIPWLFATMNMSIIDFSHGFVLVYWWSLKNSCNYLQMLFQIWVGNVKKK